MLFYCIIHPRDKSRSSCRPTYPPNDTSGDYTWHWEWISGVALAICIWVGAQFRGPPRTTLTVMLNWFPLGQAGAQFTESRWESCGDEMQRWPEMIFVIFGTFLFSRMGRVVVRALLFLNCFFWVVLIHHWCKVHDSCLYKSLTRGSIHIFKKSSV